MDIDNIIEEIRKELRGFGENIVYIKAMIENNNKSSELQLEKIEEKIKVANHRLDDLEGAEKWRNRCFWGAIITAAVAFIIRGGMAI